MAKTDELIIEIKGSIDDLTKKLDKAVKETDDATGKMSDSFSGISKGAGIASIGIGKIAAAAGIATAGVLAFNKAVEKLNEASGLKRMSDRLGIGVERFQELSFAAKAFGSDSERLSDAIKDLTVKVKDAAEFGGGFEEALNLIGLKAKDLVDLKPDQQLLKFADAIKAADENSRRFVLDEINDAMFELIPLVSQGSEGFEKWTKRARDLNVVLSETELTEMQEASRKIAEMNEAWNAMFTKITAIVATPLANFANGVSNIIAEVNGFLKGNQSLPSQGSPTGGMISKEGPQTEAELDAMMKQTGKNMVNNSQIRNLMSHGGTNDASIPSDTAGNDLMTGENLWAQPIGGSPAAGGMMTGAHWVFSEEGQSQLDAMREIELEKQREFNSSLRAIEQETADFNRMLWESGHKGKLQIMAQTFSKMGVLMNSENRKMFEIGKAARIAEVATTTPKAAMDAYSAMASIPYVGPVLGAAAAAAAVAYGAQQIQQIQSTNFKGGGGGGGAPAPSSIGAGGADVGGSQAAPNVTEATINISGSGFNREDIMGLIGGINEALGDGAELRAVTN